MLRAYNKEVAKHKYTDKGCASVLNVKSWQKVERMTQSILKASSFITSLLDNMLDLAKVMGMTSCPLALLTS